MKLAELQADIGAYEFGLGDYDCDQSVSLEDFSFFPGCMTGPHSGPNGAGCEAFDAGADQAVDLSDFAALQRTFTGR